MKDKQYYLKALSNGDSKEIQAIYQLNFPKIKRFVLQNSGQEADAEDIFQMALLQLAVRYRKQPFEISTTFEGYFYTVCKNLWRRELNKSKNRVTKDGVVELVDENEDMAVVAVAQERRELMQEYLQKISINCKKVLDLFFAKVPYSAMVEELSYSSETVARQRVFKCKSKLTELIKQDKRYQALK
jgi:RNA polymerase sigma factor (sigma-70 family)